MEVGGVELLAVFALARALDLDHVGAEVRQNLAGPGTRENAREFDDFQPLEWFQRSLPFLLEERISYTCLNRASPLPARIGSSGTRVGLFACIAVGADERRLRDRRMVFLETGMYWLRSSIGLLATRKAPARSPGIDWSGGVAFRRD